MVYGMPPKGHLKQWHLSTLRQDMAASNYLEISAFIRCLPSFFKLVTRNVRRINVPVTRAVVY